MDPLYSTDMTDAQIEEKANEVWLEAQEVLGITEDDILNAMMDIGVTKDYYAN